MGRIGCGSAVLAPLKRRKIPGSALMGSPGMTEIYCPCSDSTFSQAFERRARFCFRQASTT
jgi:hypothetical protein